MPTTSPTAATVVACHATVARTWPTVEPERLQHRERRAGGGAPPSPSAKPTATSATTDDEDGQRDREPVDAAHAVDLGRHARA